MAFNFVSRRTVILSLVIFLTSILCQQGVWDTSTVLLHIVCVSVDVGRWVWVNRWVRIIVLVCFYFLSVYVLHRRGRNKELNEVECTNSHLFAFEAPNGNCTCNTAWRLTVSLFPCRIVLCPALPEPGYHSYWHLLWCYSLHCTPEWQKYWSSTIVSLSVSSWWHVGIEVAAIASNRVFWCPERAGEYPADL